MQQQIKQSYSEKVMQNDDINGETTKAALPENNDASAELITANGGTLTSSSAKLSSQSCYSMSNFYKHI